MWWRWILSFMALVVFSLCFFSLSGRKSVWAAIVIIGAVWILTIMYIVVTGRFPTWN